MLLGCVLKSTVTVCLIVILVQHIDAFVVYKYVFDWLDLVCLLETPETFLNTSDI